MTTCPHCGTRFSDTQRLCPQDGAVLEPDQAPELDQVGKVLDGKYRIDGFLSRGGMGAVYRGTHVMLGRPVAIKLISPELVRSTDMVRRFQREARAVTHLDHPHIVKVYDLGQTSDGTLYIAMDLVAGESLNELIRKVGALSPDRIVTIMGQVSSALALAHRHGVIHRDLKPHNIMIGRDLNGRDVATLLDFGIAKTLEFDSQTKLTQTGSTLGTPHYMSPEQARGIEVDARSDLYSLGIILYEMLVGEVPFTDPSTPAVLVKHLTEQPMAPTMRRPDLQIPAGLEAIALRCLEKSPENRFQTAAEFGTELARVPVAAVDYDGTIRVSPAVLERANTPTVAAPAPTQAVGFQPAPQWQTVEETAANRPVAPTTAPTAARTAARTAAPTAPPTAAPPTSPAPRPVAEAITTAPRKGLPPFAVAAVVIVIVLLGAGYFVMTRSGEPAPDAVVSSATPAETPAAVLPTVQPITPEPAPVTPPADVAPPSAPPASVPAAPIGTRPAAPRATSPAAPAAPPAAPPPAPVATTAPAPVDPPPAAPAPAAPTPAPAAAPAATVPETAAEQGNRLKRGLGAAGRFFTGRPKGAEVVPPKPSIFFECDGPRELCAPLRTAIQEAAERAGLVIVRGGRGAEILLTAEVEEIEKTDQVTTYSMDIAGEAPRFDQEVPMPPSRTFSAAARDGAERLVDNARIAAAAAIDRVMQFWKKHLP